MLDERLLKQISSLHYLPRHAVLGQVGGKQLSKRKGLSLDFAEHRNYLAGDDYRYIDWNLYGRLDRLFVKVFVREEDYPVYLLVDLSQSMRVGNKLPYACRLAGALGYIALKDQNRLGVYPFSSKLNVERAWYPRAGWQQTLALFEFLQALAVTETTDFNHALSQFASLNLNRGLVLIFSDMFSEQGYQEGLIALRSARFSVGVLHLLAESDLDPQLPHEVWLTSAERGPSRRRLSGPESVRAYVRALQQYIAQLQAFCHHYEIGYLQLPATLSLERALLERLRGRVLA